MAAAVVLSTIAMLLFAKNVGDFVDKHPTVKVLALSFLVMIGTLLVAEAFHVHVPKGYVYFAMAFSFLVEMLNIKVRKNLETCGIKVTYQRRLSLCLKPLVQS